MHTTVGIIYYYYAVREVSLRLLTERWMETKYGWHSDWSNAKSVTLIL